MAKPLGVHPTTLSKILNHRRFLRLLLELVERIMRFADRNPQAKILIGFIYMKARHRPAACSYLMLAQLLSEHPYDSNCFTWPLLV